MMQWSLRPGFEGEELEEVSWTRSTGSFERRGEGNGIHAGTPKERVIPHLDWVYGVLDDFICPEQDVVCEDIEGGRVTCPIVHG
jgi:hypothetical protein